MIRLASAALAGAFFAASGSIALAANDDAASLPPPAHPSLAAATARLDRNAPSVERMTQALNLLEAKGYGDFRDFTADGKDFTASVNDNGRHVTVLVDPDAGTITPQG